VSPGMASINHLLTVKQAQQSPDHFEMAQEHRAKESMLWQISIHSTSRRL